MEMTLTPPRPVPTVGELNEFSSEADAFTESQWSEMISHFADANLYQTWPYGVVRSGSNVSRLVVKQGPTIVAAVQSRLARVPVLSLGMAYVLWGPLWKQRNGQPDLQIFRQAVRALRKEYADRRGWVVRLSPNLNETDDPICRQILEEEGYSFNKHAYRRSTILMNVEPSLDELCKGFHQKWRYHLNKARKQNLEIIEGEENHLFDAFARIFDEMVDRKQVANITGPDHCRKAQPALSAREKVRVFLCKADGKVCAGGICSAMGDTGIYLFGATSNQGVKNYSSYLIHWRMLEWVKAQGCRSYDLNGVNPETNPGGFQFKSQFAGANGRHVQLLGQFDAYPNAISKRLVSCAEPLMAVFKKAMSR
jgi:lipid II:glycine glycyltransferase (peptidoglycan interpeptide bridge formation enzyme)